MPETTRKYVYCALYDIDELKEKLRDTAGEIVNEALEKDDDEWDIAIRRFGF